MPVNYHNYVIETLKLKIQTDKDMIKDIIINLLIKWSNTEFVKYASKNIQISYLFNLNSISYITYIHIYIFIDYIKNKYRLYELFRVIDRSVNQRLIDK